MTEGERKYGAHLKIEQHDIHPTSTRVWLNGQDITTSLRSISVAWDKDDITQSTLVIGVRELEVDAETIANLQAHVKPKDGD